MNTLQQGCRVKFKHFKLKPFIALNSLIQLLVHSHPPWKLWFRWQAICLSTDPVGSDDGDAQVQYCFPYEACSHILTLKCLVLCQDGIPAWCLLLSTYHVWLPPLTVFPAQEYLIEFLPIKLALQITRTPQQQQNGGFCNDFRDLNWPLPLLGFSLAVLCDRDAAFLA